jgi:hypothetical protein
VESKLGPLGTSATEWPIVPAPGDYGDGEFGGMKIGRGDRSTRWKTATAPLCPPQIPLDQTRARTRDAAVGSQRLTAWAMARQKLKLKLLVLYRFQQYFHCCRRRTLPINGSSTVAYLRSYCIAMPVFLLFVSLSLPSNGSICRNM